MNTTFLDLCSLDPYNWDLSVPYSITISDVFPTSDTDMENLNQHDLWQTEILDRLEAFSDRILRKVDNLGQKFVNSD